MRAAAATCEEDAWFALAMLTNGRRALLHHDGANHRLRAAKRARQVAMTSGGAVPDNAALQLIIHARLRGSHR